jgi:ketosteroid isomerase-like protein
MKRLLVFTHLSIMLPFLCLGQQVKPDAVTLTRLISFRNDLTKALITGNLESTQAYYDDSVRLMPAYQKTMFGKANAVAYHKAFVSKFSVKLYQRDETDVIDLGQVVAEHGTLNMTLALNTTGQEYSIAGKYATFWKKQPDGKFLLITDAWNTDSWASFADLLRFRELDVVDVSMAPHLMVTDNISFELTAFNLLMSTAITQKDYKAWQHFYSDDAVLYANHGLTYSGRQSIDKYIDEHVAQMPVFEKLDIRNDQIDVYGRYVVEYASHIAIWRRDDYSGVGTGKDLRIWRREDDGTLKIIRHIGMYD